MMITPSMDDRHLISAIMAVLSPGARANCTLVIVFTASIAFIIYFNCCLSTACTEKQHSREETKIGESSRADPKLGLGLERKVYLDLGVNWCNTLSLYEQTPFFDQHGDHGFWEVYGFEASTLIQPFVEQYFDWLQGLGPKPDYGLPPTGSSKDLARFANKYNCPKTGDSMRECMWKALEVPLSKLRAEPRLNDTSLVDSRLAIASSPNRNPSQVRYTFIPAAAGTETGWITIWESPKQVIRGGALDNDPHMGAAYVKEATVRSIDLMTWITSNFHPRDTIVLKMDIEGAEHGILNKMLDHKQDVWIDTLLWECHGNCNDLRQRLKATNITVWDEGKHYEGFAVP